MHGGWLCTSLAPRFLEVSLLAAQYQAVKVASVTGLAMAAHASRASFFRPSGIGAATGAAAPAATGAVLGVAVVIAAVVGMAVVVVEGMVVVVVVVVALGADDAEHP
jgi:hypothetical protein